MEKTSWMRDWINLLIALRSHFLKEIWFAPSFIRVLINCTTIEIKLNFVENPSNPALLDFHSLNFKVAGLCTRARDSKDERAVIICDYV